MEIPQWANALTVELKTVYPAIDTERGVYIRNKLMAFEERVARQAVKEYIERGGDDFFNLGKLLAVAHRLKVQLSDGPNSLAVQTRQRRADMGERDRLADAWHHAETFVIDLPESKQRHYREEFLNGQNSTLRKLYSRIFEHAKLPKNFVAYVYQHETGRKVEQIIPPAGMAAPVVHVPAMQHDPF
jgi:hypothetical protein